MPLARGLFVCCSATLVAACSSIGGKSSAVAPTSSRVRAASTTTTEHVYPTVAGQPCADVGLRAAGSIPKLTTPEAALQYEVGAKHVSEWQLTARSATLATFNATAKNNLGYAS